MSIYKNDYADIQVRKFRRVKLVLSMAKIAAIVIAAVLVTKLV